MLYNTSSTSSITINSATYTSGLTYTYMTGGLQIEYVDVMPASPTPGTIYITSNPI